MLAAVKPIVTSTIHYPNDARVVVLRSTFGMLVQDHKRASVIYANVHPILQSYVTTFPSAKTT